MKEFEHVGATLSRARHPVTIFLARLALPDQLFLGRRDVTQENVGESDLFRVPEVPGVFENTLLMLACKLTEAV
jgi:hypothetical protein